MEDIQFLTIEQIIKMHAHQIMLFGGMHGIRDLNLLESAVYEPQATFNGKFLYADIFEMAAAYAYGIIKNHPFMDGNKRTGMISCFVFLRYNEYDIKINQKDFYNLAIAIASSKITQKEVAAYLRKI